MFPSCQRREATSPYAAGALSSITGTSAETRRKDLSKLARFVIGCFLPPSARRPGWRLRALTQAHAPAYQGGQVRTTAPFATSVVAVLLPIAPARDVASHFYSRTEWQ